MADIKQAIEYAKNNPDTPYATELRRRMESGMLNVELQQAGLQTFETKAQPVENQGGKGIGGIATGIGKGVLSTLKGAGDLGAKVGNAALKPFGLDGENVYSEESLQTDAAQGGVMGTLLQEENLAAEGGAEKIGKFVEQVAELAIPGAAVTRAGKAAQTAVKAASGSRAAGLGARAAVEGVGNAGIVAIQEGGIDTDARDAGIISAVFPVAGRALSAGKTTVGEVLKKNAPRFINSLIKPLAKDLSYGKNPGRAVAEEGIIANSLEELATKIGVRRNEVGEEITELISSRPDVKINLSDVVKPIDEAIEQARKNPRTNAGLITRLDDLKSDLLGIADDGTGAITSRKLDELTPAEAFLFKRDISDLTKFTGNASDDSAINKSLQRVYGSIKEKLNSSLSGTKSKTGKTIEQLNERYADLSSAEIATKYRDKIAERQNIISLPTNLAGTATAIGTVIATGGAVIPALALGAGIASIEKYISSPAGKTKIASWLSKSTPAERKKVFDALPAFKAAIIKTYIGD